MPEVLRFLCFFIAFVAFLASAFRDGGVSVGAGRSANLIAVGLAAFTLPFLWDAAELLGD